MSKFGETWRIDGVTAAYIAAGPANGQYQVVFERSSAELTDIEGINWESPIVEPLRADCPALTGLPQGYGFTVTDITYDHSSRSYTVTVQVAKQYLGDVSAYTAQVSELEQQLSDLTEQMADAQAQAEQAQAQVIEAQAQMEQAQAQAAQAQAEAEDAQSQVQQAQAQTAEAQAQMEQAQAQAKEALAQAAEAEAASVQKDETIAAQAQEIEVLKADSGAAVVASLEQAYEEGVESNG